jgi:two-component system LytT family response regulator
MIRTIIVENEKPQSDYLVKLLSKKFPEVDILAVCDNVPDGINKVKSLQPQLLFLDVELNPYTGFDLLEQTRDQNYEVIFTTSFNTYAKKAIKFCALDFIDKPFGIDELKEAFERYKDKATTGSALKRDALLHNMKVNDISAKLLPIPVLGGFDFVTVGDIIYCQSSNNYTDLFLIGNNKKTVTKTLKLVEASLRNYKFFRVHDSYLINLNHVKSYRRGGEGGVVELTDKHEVDVSRRKKDDFLKAIGKG